MLKKLWVPASFLAGVAATMTAYRISDWAQHRTFSQGDYAAANARDKPFCDYIFSDPTADALRICRLLDAADGHEDAAFNDLHGTAPSRIRSQLNRADQASLDRALDYEAYRRSDTSEAWQNAAHNLGITEPRALLQFYTLADRKAHNEDSRRALPPMQNEVFALVKAAWELGPPEEPQK